MTAPGGTTVLLAVCKCGHVQSSHRIFDGGREGCFCGCRLYVAAAVGQPRTFATYPDVVSLAAGYVRPESVRESEVLREAAAGERVIAENPRNVAVTVCAGEEIRMLAAMGRDFETSGDEPVLGWYRDDAGVIRGVVLLGRVRT